MSIKEFLESRADGIISPLASRTQFSTRQFIQSLMTDDERGFIQLLSEQGGEHPIRTVHQQAGLYLLNHSQSLSIHKLEGKEESPSPFGNDSETQLWEKD